jgi:RecJ-like exonuclease
MQSFRCPCCNGFGKVMGGGCITMRECDNCEGVGKLYKEETPGYKPESNEVVIDKVVVQGQEVYKRKAGRPKKC